MLYKEIQKIISFFKIIAGVMLMAMMILTCCDVIGSIFGYPILGSEELVGLMAAILLAFSLPFAHEKRSHIGVDLLYFKFPKKMKKVNDFVISLASGIFFLLMAWQCWTYGNSLKEAGRVSAVLQLPTYYILYSISLACFLLSLLIAVEFARVISGDN